jgi:hypothetical protein
VHHYRLRRHAIDSGPFSSLVTGRVSRSWSIWVSFKLEGYGVDAAEFCRQACTKTRQIAVEIDK